MKQKYSKYKNSGVEWIGEIPSHWKISKIKYVSDVVTGNTPSKSVDENYTNGTFLWIKPDELKGFLSTNDCKEKISELGLNETRQVPPLSVFVNGIGNIGKFGFSEFESSTNQQIHSIVFNKKFKKRYGLYVISSMTDEMNKNSEKVVVSIFTKSRLEELKLIYPPISEQEQIVKYLDEKTSQIDNLILVTEKKIELIKQKRTSLINEAITKGLNKDVELKDSGVEWIGEIPKHWEKIPLKHISYMKGRIGWKGLKQEEFSDDRNLPYLITGHDIKNDKIDWEKCYHISEERYEESPEIKLEINDLLFTKDGTIGKTLFIDFLPGKTSLNSHLLLIRPLNKSYQSKFLQYIFKSDYFLSYVELTKTGTTFYGVSQETMMGFNGYFPPLSEQEQIVEYIDNQTNEIDNLVSIEQRRIETLKEYRQSLISEVVTGKIKVTI